VTSWAWRIGWRLLVYPAAAWAAIATALYLLQDRLIFPRSAAGPQLPDARPRGAEVLYRDVPGGGRVEAWYVPPPRGPAPLVVLTHGNAELIDHQGDLFAFYRRLGYAVLAPEYRGYGRSAGEPSQAAIVADVVGFLDDVRSRPEIDGARVVLHGRSIGGAVAAQVARERPPAALVLESAPASVADMAHRYLLPSFLVRHPFETAEALRDAPFPVLLLHGTGDDVVPVADGRRLRDTVPHATYVEYAGGHVDLGPADAAYRAAVEPFLRAHVGPP
jgi:fermentation-respiration switch protein FrsA (DUF1100 family)